MRPLRPVVMTLLGAGWIAGTATDYMFTPGVAGGANWMGTTPNVTFTGSTGPFAQAVSYGVDQRIDGTSNTVAFAGGLVGDSMATSVWGTVHAPPSKYRGNMVYDADPADELNRPHDAFQNPAIVMSMLQACNAMFQSTSTHIGDDHGYRWAIRITGYTLFNTIQTPNDRQFPFAACRLDGNPSNYPDRAFVFASSSAHPGGINVGFADGSVRFVKDGINRTIWWSLGTKAGGEAIGADSY